MIRINKRRGFWLVCLISILPAVSAAAPLEIGILPYLTARGVIHTYEPLRSHLEERLARPVILVSAPDFQTFLERTQRGAYPLVITAPHFARLAQLEAAYTPLLMAQARLTGLLVTASDSNWNSVRDLRDETVLLPDPLTIVAMLGVELLADHGLEVDTDVRVVYMPTHADAAMGAGRGDAAAAIVSRTALRQFSPSIQDSVRVIGETSEAPHIMLLAHPDLDAQLQRKVSEAVHAFASDTAEGRSFAGTIGTGALSAPSERELEALDRFVMQLRRSLEEHPR